jgi:nitronate monooxygenase
MKLDLTLPLIAAPMLRVSGPALVSAACRAGIVGAFPTVNARGPEGLEAWLTQIDQDLERARDAGVARLGPVCPNLIMRRPAEELQADLEVLIRHRVRLVVASVGSPAPVIAPLHEIGCTVFADVANLRHAEKALQAGADGLVLLSAGAGGQTGWVNGFSFVRAVRQMFDGPIILSGGINDGAALWAAEVLGADLCMMGTRFIATPESLAVPGYKQMLVDSRLDDVLLTKAFTGLETNMLRPSIVACGLDPDALQPLSTEEARARFSAQRLKKDQGPQRWVDIWSAGHSVSGVQAVTPVADLVREITTEYEAARQATRRRLS